MQDEEEDEGLQLRVFRQGGRRCGSSLWLVSLLVTPGKSATTTRLPPLPTGEESRLSAAV